MSISRPRTSALLPIAGRVVVPGLLVAWLLWTRFAAPSAEADLYPSPDAIQYTASAWNMSAGAGYTVLLGGELHPPRYPIGFPLTLVPVYLLGGTRLHHAAWAVLLTSLLLFLPVGLFASRLSGRGSALWAVLFVGLSPLLVNHSTRIMSESLTVLLVAVIYSLEARQARALTLGLLGGYAATVRYTNLMALLPSFLRIVSRGSLRERLRGLLGMAFGVALFVVPMALQHHDAYGSASRDGYAYWHPDRYENAGYTFSWDYAWTSPTVTWTRRPVGLAENYARDLAGLSRSLYTPLVPLLALLGVALVLRSERHAGDAPSSMRFLSYPLFLYLFYVFYYGEDRRFFLPVLVPVAAFAAHGAHWITSRFRPWRARLVAAGLAAALFATSLPETLHGPRRPPQLRYRYAEAYDRLLPLDAFLVTTLDVLYLEYYFVRNTHRRVFALTGSVAHATAIAPSRLPPPPHSGLKPAEFQAWALAHGARHPVPIFRGDRSPADWAGSGPIFLDSELSERRVSRMVQALGFQIQPLTPPGPRRLYRLTQRPEPAARAGDLD